MIKRESKLKITDNSGVRLAQCIGFLKSIKCDTVKINEIISVCLKKFDKKKFLTPKGKNKIIKKHRLENAANEKKNIYKALTISCRKNLKRNDGTYVKTLNNRAVLLSENWKFLGSKILGPVLKETRKKRKIPFFKELLSYAKNRI